MIRRTGMVIRMTMIIIMRMTTTMIITMIILHRMGMPMEMGRRIITAAGSPGRTCRV